MFLSKKNVFKANQDDFKYIPGIPYVYWISKNVICAFESANTIGTKASPRLGFATGDNDTFMRVWNEVDLNKIGFGFSDRDSAKNSGMKWFPTNKGGSYRRWYGNLDLIVDWENDGEKIRNFRDENGKLRSRPQNLRECFSDGITWTVICNHSSFRYSPLGMLYNNKGPILGHKQDPENYLYLGLLNSVVSEYFLQMLSPTLGFESGYVSNIPYIMDVNRINNIKEKVISCIKESKSDWDSFEVSWDFKSNPLINNEKNNRLVSEKYTEWETKCIKRFNKVKSNEEELNQIFINIYGLQNELSPKVEDRDVTIRKAELQRDIKSLISYAVGCMFGRYSLDVEGLAYAGGEWDGSKYTTFIPDADNIIPITDEEYFEDDILGLFIAWLKKAYGSETLEQNLDFIAKALGNKGNTAREVIRNYFLTDFFKDHCQTYSVTGSGKRPIYWLFDSGMQNGFKALIYLHRYNADTIGNLRVDYLHRMQRVYESEIGRMQDMIDHSTNSREVGAASRRKEKLQKQLKECREYDEKIGHLALARTELDLDDGVKVNYRKLQTANNGKFYEVLADSKNIMAKK